MQSHKHKDLIIAWANGAEIQYLVSDDFWEDTYYPKWSEDTIYRVKPLSHEKQLIGALQECLKWVEFARLENGSWKLDEAGYSSYMAAKKLLKKIKNETI